jgi:hypothetical protein
MSADYSSESQAKKYQDLCKISEDRKREAIKKRDLVLKNCHTNSQKMKVKRKCDEEIAKSYKAFSVSVEWLM